MVCKKAFKNRLLACLCVLVICFSVHIDASASDSIEGSDISVLSLDEDAEFNMTIDNSVNPVLYLYNQGNLRNEDGTSVDISNAYSYQGLMTMSGAFDPSTAPVYIEGYLYRDITLTRCVEFTGDVHFTFPVIHLVNAELPDDVTISLENLSYNADAVTYRIMFRFNKAEFLTYSQLYNLTFDISASAKALSNYFGSSYTYLAYNVSYSSDWGGDIRSYTSIEDKGGMAALVGSFKRGVESLLGNISSAISTLKTAVTDKMVNLIGSVDSQTAHQNANSQAQQSIIHQQTQQQKQDSQAQLDAIEEQTEQQHEDSKNIFDKIADFFDNFFSRLGEFLLGLIVPSAEELTAFLDEVNDWFGERLGFIWYPFSFAVDMVSALANGTANTGFQVPEFRLNILGAEYQIWSGMTVDLDAFGIFKYVRIFTSFLLVAGIVKLALDKWDEWIGGHGVG